MNTKISQHINTSHLICNCLRLKYGIAGCLYLIFYLKQKDWKRQKQLESERWTHGTVCTKTKRNERKKNMSACTQTCTYQKPNPTKTKEYCEIAFLCRKGLFSLFLGQVKIIKNFSISLVISIKWSNASDMFDYSNLGRFLVSCCLQSALNTKRIARTFGCAAKKEFPYYWVWSAAETNVQNTQYLWFASKAWTIQYSCHFSCANWSRKRIDSFTNCFDQIFDDLNDKCTQKHRTTTSEYYFLDVHLYSLSKFTFLRFSKLKSVIYSKFGTCFANIAKQLW